MKKWLKGIACSVVATLSVCAVAVTVTGCDMGTGNELSSSTESSWTNGGNSGNSEQTSSGGTVGGGENTHICYYDESGKCPDCSAVITFTEGLDYKLNEDGKSYTVTDIGIAEAGALYIPYTYEGKPVTAIGWAAFEKVSSITSVFVPDSVKLIEYKAFDGCTSLKEVTLCEGIEEIQQDAFKGCGIQSVKLPNSLIKLSRTAFNGTSALTLDENQLLRADTWVVDYFGAENRLTIPAGVRGIAAGVFNGNKNLRVVELPEGLVSIDTNAFSMCSELRSINFPASLKRIGDGVFQYCNNLSGALVFPDSLLSVGGGAFASCTEITSITLGENTDSVGDSAFLGCSGLSEVTFNDKLTSIGGGAFYSSGLTSITLPASLKEVGMQAFANCVNLTKAVFKDGIISIGENVFGGSSVGEVVLPNTLESIGPSAFLNCGNLTEISFPESLKGIEEMAFEGCEKLNKAVFMGNIASIGWSAFSGCVQLESVTIDDNATIPSAETYVALGSNAFDDCAALHTLELSAVLKYIGGDAFRGCVSLKKLSIPNTIEDFSKNAISDCTKLEYATYGNGFYLGNSANPHLILCSADIDYDTFTVHENTKLILERAFGFCNMTEITIPDKVVSIATEAFYECDKLQSIRLGKGVTRFYTEKLDRLNSLATIIVDEENTAFSGKDGILYNKDMTEVIFVPGKLAGDIVLPDSLTVIPKDMLWNRELIQTITVPHTVTEIQSNAFRSCEMLKTIYLFTSTTNIDTSAVVDLESLEEIIVNNADNTSYYSQDGILYTKDKTQILFVPMALKGEIAIAEGITKLYTEQFYNLDITAVYLPSTLKTVENSAFSWCNTLTELHYNGTKEQFLALNIKEYAFDWDRITVVHCNDGDIVKNQ